jgi:hypothetical protein
MRMLCDRMINRSEDSTRCCRFKLSVSDSDTLIEGLQSLFEHSSDDEQIRLLTIAPTAWGRKKIGNFFNSTEHQARAAIELRLTDGILALPASFRGNKPINPDTIKQVLNYYRRDGISRPSPNRKDVVLINGTSVGKRFMEITISQAFRFFSIDNPALKIRKSKFFSLRPKDVKPKSPHDVCLCIYHENVSLLL